MDDGFVFTRLRRRSAPLKCEVCGSPLSPVRVRLEAGASWSGPYYECSGCGDMYRTEDGRLIPYA
jgi:RNase P subunit RPR2